MAQQRKMMLSREVIPDICKVLNLEYDTALIKNMTVYLDIDDRVVVDMTVYPAKEE